MEDSHRNRARITAFLVANGGRVTSGNDNVYAFMYRKMAPASYDHEHVTSLRKTVEAMAGDGLVSLERRSDGKVTAIRLLDDAELEEFSADERSYFESTDAIWLLVARLLSLLQAARKNLHSTLEAFDSLTCDVVTEQEKEALHERIRQLEEALAVAQSPCGHDEEIARVKREAERRLNEVRQADRLRYDELREEFRRYRRDAQDRYARDGQQISELKDALDQLPPGLVEALRSGRLRMITL